MRHLYPTSRRPFCPTVFFFTALILAVTTLASCSKSAPEWVEPEAQPAPDALLKVHTRGAEGDQTPAFPIRIYAFDAAGLPAGAQTITAADQTIALPLAAGDYTLYALTGADAARYDIPAADNLTPAAPVALKTDGDTHGKVGAASESITLANGETSQVTLTVTRIVAQLTASLTNIPDDITAIAVRVAPLHTGFTLGGTLSGSGGIATVALTRTAPGEWGTAAPLFILPGTGDATVTIALTGPGGTTEYTYSSDTPLAANYRLHIGAHYEAAPVLDGSITDTDWAGDTDIVFGFGPGTDVTGTPAGNASDTGNGNGNGNSSGSGTGGDGDNPADAVAKIPSPGDTYRGCYVLSATPTGTSSATVLLVAPRQWAEITGTSSAELLARAATEFSTFTHDELTGWRLPDYNEAALLLNAIHTDLGALNAVVTTGGPAALIHDYIYTKDGVACKFKPSVNTDLSVTPVSSGTYHALAVLTLAVTAGDNK